MDGNHTPGALHAELFEEGCGDDGLGARERVRVQECSAEDADDNDAEASTEDLGAVSDGGSASHGSQVCNDLGHCYCVGREFELIRQHRRVEILRSMRPNSDISFKKISKRIVLLKLT